MPRVILLHPSERFNLEPAKEFGRIMFLLQNRPNPFDPQGLFKLVLSRLKAEKYDPHKDMICLTGPSLLVAEFLSAVCCRYKTVRLLMFNAPTESYILEEIDTTEAKKYGKRTTRIP